MPQRMLVEMRLKRLVCDVLYYVHSQDDVANESDLDQDNNVIETEDASYDDVETTSEDVIYDFYGDDETESTILIRRHSRRSWRRFQQ